MRISAPAKLNLYLEITGKREDGYHLLNSLAVFIDLYDEISVSINDELIVEGSYFPDEIMLKAANLLQTKFSVSQGAKFYLQKNVPVGGGLGGGSTDAAAVILLLKDLWNLTINEEEMFEIALQLGADVPACLYALLKKENAVIFSGIGEKLKPTSINDMFFVLVNPKKELSTKAVFENYQFSQQEAETNHLQKTAINLMPEIADIIAALGNSKKCKLARMTGSGATCFGVFDNAEDAEDAARTIANTHPHWWVQSCKTI